MGFGGLLFATTALQAVSQIGQGYAQKEEAKYNATVLEGQAGMIDVQKDIEYGQYQRLKGKTMSDSMVGIAGMGIMPQGSALAVMLDAQTQIGIDQAIGQFNFEREKNYKLAEASAERRRGRQAVYTGWSNAFSTALQGASNYAMYNGLSNRPTTITTNSTFDYSLPRPSLVNRANSILMGSP